MPEPYVYSWDGIGKTQPWMQIHKTNGNLYWNTKTNYFLRGAVGVGVQYDGVANCIGIAQGDDYTVQHNEEDLYFITAKQALMECGLTFPLDDHISGVPIPQQIGKIFAIFQLP